MDRTLLSLNYTVFEFEFSLSLFLSRLLSKDTLQIKQNPKSKMRLFPNRYKKIRLSQVASTESLSCCCLVAKLVVRSRQVIVYDRYRAKKFAI